MIYQENGKLYRRCDRELLCIEGWGNGLRVRSTTTGRIRDLNYGLHGEKKEKAARISIDGEYAEIANGEITCKILSTGKLRFFNATNFGWLIADATITLICAAFFIFLPAVSFTVLGVFIGIYMVTGGASVLLECINAKEFIIRDTKKTKTAAKKLSAKEAEVVDKK